MLLILLLLALALVFVYARWIEPAQLTVRRVSLPSPEGARLRVVFFGDTHFSKTYGAENMQRIAREINALEPDLVVFTGDLIDSYYRSPPDLTVLEQGLAAISARYGKFAVRGNHDIGGGAARVYGPVMAAGGFRLLVNESTAVEGLLLTVTGIDDPALGHPDMALPAKAGRREGLQLLLSHEPDMVDLLDLSGVSLVLSGHTHGGQIYLPFLTRLFLPPGGRNYRKGLFALDGGSSLYVTSGIGTTQLPLRFGNVPEIVCIDWGV